MGFVLLFSSDFHENRFLRSLISRVLLIKSVLKSSESGACRTSKSDIGAVLDISKLVDLLQILKKIAVLFPVTRTFQKCSDRFQVVGFWRLTHHSMRQDQSSPASLELAPYDTLTTE